MLDKKRMVTAGGTLACALGIGFIMQSGDTAEGRYGAVRTADASLPISIPPIERQMSTDILLDIEDITLTSAEAIVTPNVDLEKISAEEPVETAAAPQSTLALPEPDRLKAQDECSITAKAEPMAAAMIQVSLSAPCMTNERVTVHHSGLIFTETTDADGQINTTVPALSQNATFVFSFVNGDGAVVETKAPALEFYDRVVVQWKGNSGFQMHIREFGAAYGEHGHIWQETPGSMENAVAGQSGFLTQVGDIDAPEPLVAQIYTFPSGTATTVGEIALSVEAEVTPRNCGEEIEANSIEVHAGTSIRTQDLILAVPNCAAVGDFLVLNNLLKDLKIAQN